VQARRDAERRSENHETDLLEFLAHSPLLPDFVAAL